MKTLSLIAAIFVTGICADLCFGQNYNPEKAEFLVKTGQKFLDEGQYQTASDTLQKAITFFEKTGNISGLIRSLNLQGESFYNLNQCDKAIKVLNRSLQLAKDKRSASHAELSQTYYHLSVASGKCARKIDEAIQLLNKSIAIKEKLYGSQSPEIAYDYTFMGFLYDNKEQSDSAILFLNKALSIRENKLAPNDIELANTHHNFGQVYENQSELDKALTHHLRALNIRQTKLGDAHLSTLHSINAIGSVYRKLGNFDRALEYYRYALENRRKALGEIHSDVSCSYYSIANLHNAMFDYHSAIPYFLQGHRILEQLYGSDTDVLPAYYAVTAKVYGLIGDHQRAKVFIEKTEKTADKNLGKDHPYRGIAFSFIGEYYGETGDSFRQMTYFKKAIDIFHKAWGAGTVREADVLFKMGSTHAKNKQFAAAIHHYEKALAIYEQIMGRKIPKTASVHLAIGNVYKDQGKYDKALELFQEAFSSITISVEDIARPYANPDLDELESKSLALQVAGSKGETLLMQGLAENNLLLLKQSLNTYVFAMQLIDQINAGYNNESAKIELEKQSRVTYNGAIQVAFELYQRTRENAFMETAFGIAEKSKSVLLTENIRDVRGKTLAGIPDSLMIREKDIKIELAYYNNELYLARKEKDETKEKMCEKNIFEVQQRYDHLKEKLEWEYPVYYNFKYNIRTTGISELQRMLPDEKTSVVEFFTGDSAIYIFTVSKRSVQLLRRRIDAGFARLFSDYERSLTDQNFILNSRWAADSLYVKSAYSLYEFLLQPSFNSAENPIEKLIIIPDDVLAQINFGTLITNRSAGENVDYETLDYLIKQCRISYAYSAAFIKNDTIRVKKPKHSFAGFAPSYSGNSFAGIDTVLHPLAYQVVRSGNLPLPGAEEEVKDLSDLMKGKSWLNAEATETNFKQHAGNFNILHLAMHSLLDNEQPEHSELLFNPEKDKWNDGYLKVSEIYNLDLTAELVVLSTCSSGYGKIQKGEGPISISRAFSYAGCPSVVMSLWKVPDDVTHQLMTFFYAGLKDGKPKDEALRLAQFKLLNETQNPLYRHPYFWAGFVVTGNTEPISSSSTLWTMAGVCMIAVAVVFVTLKRRRIHASVFGRNS